ncbi:MAG: ComF family protein [Cyanobacteriota bacterium]
MLSLLWHGLRELISVSPCPRCRRALTPGEPANGLCLACQADLGLSKAGLQGHRPLPWWALGWYEGDLRRLLLNLRPHPRQELIEALAEQLSRGLACNLSWQDQLTGAAPLLVAIPGWKRHSNPLPAQLSNALQRRLGCQERPLLRRSRPTVGQHHLNHSLRQSNQRGSFAVLDPAPANGPAVVLIDDILTSGATARAAAEALQERGWAVAGLLCLARTPRRQNASPWAMV